MTSPTYKYCTVPYGLVYEKKNRSLVFSGSRKIPTLGSTVQWETRLAEFPTGTVGPQVGIFLSPLNTNDGFYLSLAIIVYHHSASLVMPIGDPQDGFFYPTLTLRIDAYILTYLILMACWIIQMTWYQSTLTTGMN